MIIVRYQTSIEPCVDVVQENRDDDQHRVFVPGAAVDQICHDLRHEIATIALLTSNIAADSEAPDRVRRQATQILAETRWLNDLVRAHEDAVDETSRLMDAEPIAVDRVVAEVVKAISLSTPTTLRLRADAAWARLDRLALWRVLRNLCVNAVHAAGPTGTVEVRVEVVDESVIIDVDDTGPGFDAPSPGGRPTLGLAIAEHLAEEYRGGLEIRTGAFGGCCVRLSLPRAQVGPAPTPAPAPASQKIVFRDDVILDGREFDFAGADPTAAGLPDAS